MRLLNILPKDCGKAGGCAARDCLHGEMTVLVKGSRHAHGACGRWHHAPERRGRGALVFTGCSETLTRDYTFFQRVPSAAPFSVC